MSAEWYDYFLHNGYPCKKISTDDFSEFAVRLPAPPGALADTYPQGILWQLIFDETFPGSPVKVFCRDSLVHKNLIPTDRDQCRRLCCHGLGGGWMPHTTPKGVIEMISRILLKPEETE